jgi:uncharacterized protein (DUF3084 family)
MSGLQLVAGLIVAGAVIAYIGDRIGMKVGRKRLTLFGMRPRYTSILITISTGALIAAASIGLLTIVSRDVRMSLFRMKEIQVELAQNRKVLRSSLEQLKELEATVADQRSALVQIERTRDAAVRERDIAKTERDELQREYDKVRTNIDQLQGELERWKIRVAELKELGAALEDSVAKMQTTEKQLRQDVITLTEQYLALENQMRAGNFVYLKEEIIAATVVEGGRSQKEIENDLLAFLEKADELALERGAKIDGKQRAVTLARDDYFFQAAQVLASGQGPWVVRAVASRNTVNGEPVQVYFHLFPNELIYREGETIAQRIINGGRSDNEQTLLGLLQEVNRIAIDKGMITTARGDVGSVAGEQFIDAVVRLRRIGSQAKVSAVAARDIYLAEGPLQLELRVEANRG